MSAWSNHIEKWQGGCGSSLCTGATKQCFARGKLPCDVLMVGEAPGTSEDLLGRPFCGPAGHLLDKIINQAIETVGTFDDPPRIAFTNLVACIPRSDDGDKFSEPPKEAIKTCAGRLRELVRIAKPKLIVLVGQLAKRHIQGASQFRLDGEDEQPEWIEDGRFLEFIEITHPAAILRADVSSRGLLIQRCVVQLATAFEDLALPF